jgi:alpha-tubulin suppressor-like RCC1 family protein
MNNFFYYIAVGWGENHTILVMKDGKLFSFGLNDYGQLGHGQVNSGEFNANNNML